jgi:hypothetical protein
MIVLTLIFHNYWSLPGNIAGMQETHFRKNLAESRVALLMLDIRGRDGGR